MSATLDTRGKVAQTDAANPRDSSVPLLDDRQGEQPRVREGEKQVNGLKSKRRLFGFGKKKDDKSADTNNNKDMPPPPAPKASATSAPSTTARPVSPLQPSALERKPQAASPQRSPRIYPAMPSPSRRYRSSSPGLHSPASSQIFERNVQESLLPGEVSPAIPSHIQTEDHIPPVLEASSIAITDDHLNPDEVEIVMHAAHQPAVVAVSGSMEGSMVSPSVPSAPSASADDISAHQPDADDSASNYGSLDAADIRRLSFISFADVVQAEHAETNREAMHLLSMSSANNRSPSPVRSPASSHGMSTSPPTSQATSLKGFDAVSPKYARTPGSPVAAQGTHSPPLGGGDLHVETMRQALRKTGSGDLSGARSQPLSAVSFEDTPADRPPFR